MWSFLSSLGFSLEPLRSSVARGFAILVAGQCCCCGLPSDTPDPLCSYCCATLPRVQNPCIRCGISCADLSGSATHRAAEPAPRHDDELVPLCSACLLTPPAFDYCCSAFAYRSPIDRLVSGLKFNARGDIGVALSGQLCHRLQSLYSAKSGTHPWPSAVLAIPLHPARLRQRGYNQAFEVSKILSRRLKICDLSHSIYRKKRTSPQTELITARQRKENLRGAFGVRASNKLGQHAHVAILDDVVTTSATVAELTRTLRSHGVRRIDVWCLARTE